MKNTCSNCPQITCTQEQENIRVNQEGFVFYEINQTIANCIDLTKNKLESELGDIGWNIDNFKFTLLPARPTLQELEYERNRIETLLKRYEN